MSDATTGAGVTGSGIERAAYHTRLEALLAYTGPCERLYFGHEFCQRLLPSPLEANRAYEHARTCDKGFTLVTPFVTNAGLARVRLLLTSLLATAAGDPFEVVVNDWGVLHLLHREHPELPLALGRLLTKQKRGPRIMNMADVLPAGAWDHFQRANSDVPHLSRFLESQGVARVELDNLLQGISRSGGLTASLWYPFLYITTTRLCLLMSGDRPEKNLRSLGTCGRECRTYRVTLTHKDMPVPILVQGNTQFFRNDRLPEDLAALNISRLVFAPDIPA